MAKRSPILGYNHNVRYRGLIFHVQTEDSGQATPHLFTHLFYGGVIISSRKLVYDAGSAEDSIKGLMQSQHKVVMKDLKRGTFDDKIDQYLGDAEGLLPREGAASVEDPATAPPSPSASELDTPRPSAPEITLSRPETEQDISLELEDDLDPPTEPPALARAATPPPIPQRRTGSQGQAAPPAPTVARTQTAERRSAPTKVKTTLPQEPATHGLDAVVFADDADHDAAGMAAAVAAANATVRTVMPTLDSGPEVQLVIEPSTEPSEVIHLTNPRQSRDTEVQPEPRAGSQVSDGVPGSIGAAPSGGFRRADTASPVEKRSAVGAAALPPARPIQRPPSRQAMTPPAVVARPVTGDRARTDSDAVEIYAAAPPSADAPPGLPGSERPGQYAQHKRGTQRLPNDLRSEQSGSIPIPSGLSRPGRPSSPAPSRSPTPGSGPIPRSIMRDPSSGHSVPVSARSGTPSSAPTRAGTSSSAPTRAPDLASRPLERPRSPTPARVSAGRVPSSQSGGVVMTRPAVIVGAPARPTTPPRVRKAREEEGRGFGQGLISEKSLDEVILAYLSEDADDT